MNRMDPPSCRDFFQDHGFSREIIDRPIVEFSGQVKSARDPGDIPFLPDDNIAPCARHGARVGDVFRQMFALIFVARLHGTAFDNQGVRRQQRHHSIGLTSGKRSMKIFRRGSDRGRINRSRFAERLPRYDEKAGVRE